jgi:hypothetical protein
MSSSNNEDIPIKLAQEIREHRIIRRFDFSIVPEGPHRGAVILRALGFGVVRLVGIDPDQARTGILQWKLPIVGTSPEQECG